MVEESFEEQVFNSLKKDIQNFVHRHEEPVFREQCFTDDRLRFLTKDDIEYLINFFKRGADASGGDSTSVFTTFTDNGYTKTVGFDLREKVVIMCIKPSYLP